MSITFIGLSMQSLLVFAFFLCLAVSSVRGQFTTILNIPPAPDVGDNQSISSNTQLNLSDGGSIGHLFEAGLSDGTSTNLEVNISGGNVDTGFDAFGGSVVNISGGIIENLDAIGSTVNMSGGFVGGFRSLGNSSFNISGGWVEPFTVFTSESIDISGGTIRQFTQRSFAGTVNISGGYLGPWTTFLGDVNFSGGTLDLTTTVGETGKIDISGGTIVNGFKARDGAEVSIRGTKFLLDGIDITNSLIENIPFAIIDRFVPLTGILADGSSFDFDLGISGIHNEDSFSNSALLSVTLVKPEDYDGSGYVNGLDFLKWQRGETPNTGSDSDLAAWEVAYSTGSTISEPGDFDGNRGVNGLDFLAWQRGESPYPLTQGDFRAWQLSYGKVNALSAVLDTVPEPTTCTLALAALCLEMIRWRMLAR